MTGRVVVLSEDDLARLDGIAGELEHLPPEIARHFDQDGRDARFLRILLARLSQPVEQEEEYRVVGNRPKLGGELEIIRAKCGLEEALAVCALYESDTAIVNVRIQHRTVYRSKWADLEGGSDEAD